MVLPFHQIEGVITQNGLHYYLTMKLCQKPIINSPQQLQLDLSPFLSHYLQQ
jgi:hypothetical protein